MYGWKCCWGWILCHGVYQRPDIRGCPDEGVGEPREEGVVGLCPGLQSDRADEVSFRSAIRTLTRLSSIPLPLLNLPSSFAPPPDSKPYFPRQVTSLLRVSAAQSRAKSKDTGKEVGEIWGTRELREWFERGAREIADDEKERGVGSVVHGDYKLDNLVCPL